MMAMPFVELARRRANGKRRIAVLVSGHRDGRLISQTIRYFGVDTVTGSSTRGGMEGMRNLIRELEGANIAAITPDGPKGPVYKAKSGVVKLAQECQVPIYPLAYSAKRKHIFGSWDQMLLPKPFSKAVWVVGEPVLIAADEDAEHARQRVETAINEVTRQADELAAR